MENKLSIGIPAIPREYYEELLKLRDSSVRGPFLKWYIQSGTMVKRNDIIGEYSVKTFKANHVPKGYITVRATIVAPVDGLIQNIRPIDHCEWDFQTEGEYPHKRTDRRWVNKGFELPDDKIQFYIIPDEKYETEENDHAFNSLITAITYDSYEDIKDYSFLVRSRPLFQSIFGVTGFKDFNPEYYAEKLLADVIPKIKVL